MVSEWLKPFTLWKGETVSKEQLMEPQVADNSDETRVEMQNQSKSLVVSFELQDQA